MEKVLVKLGDNATMFWDSEYDQKVISKTNVVEVYKTSKVQEALYSKHLLEATKEEKAAFEKEKKTQA